MTTLMTTPDAMISSREKVSALKGKSVAVVTYTHKKDGKPTYIAGPSQDLKRYLVARAGRLLFIEQPASFSDDLSPTAEWYEGGRLVKALRFWMFRLPPKMRRPDIDSNVFAYALFKLRDVLSTLYFFVRVPRKFDYCVGVEAVNAMLGMLLRFFGRAKTIVYDVIDYSPVRFPNSKLNRIFHAMDAFCVRRSDFSWSQTRRVIEERVRRGVPERGQLVKPTGVDAAKLEAIPFAEVKKNQMIYVGAMFFVDGIELLIESLPLVKEKIPGIKLVLIGYGGQLEACLKRAEELGVRQNIECLGAVSDPAQVDRLIRESAVGLAPYRENVKSVKEFNDTAKPKLYLQSGTPVVMTRATLFSQELNGAQAGAAVAYDPKEWAEAVVRIMGDPQRLERCRESALRLAGKYRWENIFDSLFSRMGAGK